MPQWNDKGKIHRLTDSHRVFLFHQDSKQNNALNLVNVAGIFYILIGGLALATFIAVLEFLVKANKEAKKNKVRLSDCSFQNRFKSNFRTISSM